ncbi:MAG: helicase-related protein [Mariniphaga sp.]
MSTKFFTNSGDNTLLNKFEGVFKFNSVNAFDALVGFFRSSGYFRIQPFLAKVEKVRILVGIDVDNLISESARKGLEFKFNAELTKEELISKIKEDIQEAEYSLDVENGIIQFIEDVVNEKLIIKAHPSRELHSKIYIFRPDNFNEHNSGSVITGSSNLSEAGLEKNFEFNVELRDFDDVAFALKTFEELWKESVDILPADLSNLKKSTYLNDEFTPYEIYIKFLIEYFGNSIEYDPESITDLPKGYKKLHYQIDAVNDGYNKLIQHNGFVLADVVGLGKTIIATIIAKKFYFINGYRSRILVIHPPALKYNWEKTIRDFEVPNVSFITNGSLHKIKYPEDYDLIIVDEAHKFRSDESEMFNQLQKLCKTARKRPDAEGNSQKKIILVTATPLNNKPDDIRNQLYLFQDSKNSTLPVGNLQNFFRPLIDRYNRLKKSKDNTHISNEIKKIYKEIREKILEPIIVRRTRTDIRNTEEYWNDIVSQGISFPDIVPPRQLLYQLDDQLNELYDKTLSYLKNTNSGLGYYRYQAIRFLPKEVKDILYNKRAEMISDSLAKIMKTLLVKRIDSSFFAFKKTLHRFLLANTAMKKMLDNNRVFIAPKLNVNEFVLNEETELLEEILRQMEDPEQIQAFSKEDFDIEFIEGIEHDQQILKDLDEEWKKIEYDPKYDEFLKRLQDGLFSESINDNHKLVVFSESKETTNYLKDRLIADGVQRIFSVDSSNQKDLVDVIAENFDANYKQQRNDYDLVITTEVLAEGVNLHRSNVILNYDIPWNATRLMQRIGRVNRIGTDSSKIYIYNFFPTSQADSEIELNKKAFMKLQAFHSALGEDSQIYSQDEEFESFGLFEKVPDEDRDERLIYLNHLRSFREQNPDWFKKIRDTMPLRARTGRKRKLNHDCTMAYIKNKKRDCFYYLYPDLKLEELTFIEAAQIFEAHETEKPVALHEKHHEQINQAIESFRSEESLLLLGEKGSVKLGPNEQRAIAFVNDCYRLEFANDMEKDRLNAAKMAIRNGRFQKLPREINKLIKDANKEQYKLIDRFSKLMDILKNYPLLEHASEEQSENKKAKVFSPANTPKIIISESFV